MPRRPALSLLVLVGLVAAPAAHGQQASDPSPPTQPRKSSNAITLSVPQSYDFSQSVSSSPSADQAQRLRNAPLPDPNAVKKPSDSLHDPNTGADTTPFGSAYSYANPLYGPQGPGSVQNAASKSAATPAPQGLQFTVFQWGYPRPPMPKVAGEDLTAAPPPVPVIDFAVQADDSTVLDAKASATIGRAVQAYGRAALTRITIERPAHRPECCARYPDLVRAALIGSGLSPDHLLPGHQVRVVMTTLPVKK